MKPTSHTERGKTKKKVREVAIFAVLADRRRRGGVNSNESKKAWSRSSALFLYNKSFIVKIYVDNSESADEYNTKNINKQKKSRNKKTIHA